MSVLEVLTLLLAFFAPTDLPAEPLEAPVSHEVATVIHVADGDTVLVSLTDQTGSTHEEWVRYIGIDTPEEARDDSGAECWSAEATAANEVLVANQEVRLVADQENRDRFGRLLRYVYVGEGQDEIFVNAELAASGHATVLTIPPNTAHAHTFSALVREAEDTAEGLWGVCRE